jgi:hypothetical protein
VAAAAAAAARTETGALEHLDHAVGDVKDLRVLDERLEVKGADVVVHLHRHLADDKVERAGRELERGRKGERAERAVRGEADVVATRLERAISLTALLRPDW